MPVATAQTELSVRDKDLQKGLKRGVSSIRQYGQKVKTALKVAVVGFAAVGGAASLLSASFIKTASDMEEIKSKFTAVFKSLTPEAEAFVMELSDQLGRGRLALTGFMATLQDTFVPMGFARKEGLEMAKVLTKLTIDLESFNPEAGSAENVLRDLQSALVGNHETMRKYGVIITQTSLQQELLNMGVTENIKEVSEQQKAMARVNIIIRGTADAQGDALRTAGSYANKVRALSSAWENLSVTIGNMLLPAASRLVQSLTTVIKWVDKQAPAIEKWVKNIQWAGEVIGEWFINNALMPFIRTGIQVFTFYDAVIMQWADISELAATKVDLAFEKTGSFLTNLFTKKLPADLIFWRDTMRNILITITSLFDGESKNMLKNLRDNISLQVIKKALGLEAPLFDDPLLGPIRPVERDISEREKKLEEKAKELGEKIGEALGDGVLDKTQERMDKLTAIFMEIFKGLPDVDLPGAPGGPAAAAAVTPAKRKKDLKPAFVGLAEAWKRITIAAAGTDTQKEDIKKTAMATQKTATATEKGAKTAEKQQKTLESIDKRINLLGTFQTAGVFAV